MADLQEILRKIDEAEARLQPQIVEGRGVIQDLKRSIAEAKEELKRYHRDEIQRMIQAEMDKIVPELRNLKEKLEEVVFGRAEEILGLLDENKRHHERILERYDEVEALMKSADYVREISLPVPTERARRKRG